ASYRDPAWRSLSRLSDPHPRHEASTNMVGSWSRRCKTQVDFARAGFSHSQDPLQTSRPGALRHITAIDSNRHLGPTTKSIGVRRSKPACSPEPAPTPPRYDSTGVARWLQLALLRHGELLTRSPLSTQKPPSAHQSSME